MKNKFIIYYFLFKLKIFKPSFSHNIHNINKVEMINSITHGDESYKILWKTLLEIYADYLIESAIKHKGIKNLDIREIYKKWKYDRERVKLNFASDFILNSFMELSLREGVHNFLKDKEAINNYKNLYNS